MSIVIDADKLWKAITTNHDDYIELGELGELIYDGEMEAQTAQQWIPVAERLPQNENTVLTTYICENKRYVEEGSCYKGSWCLAYDEYRINNHPRTIVAWMPLPTPYKGE